MGHTSVYGLVKADSADSACAAASCKLEDKVGQGRWYDYGLVETQENADKMAPNVERVTLLQHVRQRLQSALNEAQGITFRNALADFDTKRRHYLVEEMEVARGGMGYAALRVGQIALEDFCEDMPFYNFESDDWELPENDTAGCDSAVDEKWWAVLLDLHC